MKLAIDHSVSRVLERRFLFGNTKGQSFYIAPATIAFCCVCSSHAATLASSPQSLYSLLPRNTQGDNGVFTQVRLSDGSYVDMIYNYSGLGDYSWSYLDSNQPGTQIYRDNNANTTTTSGPISSPDSIYSPGSLSTYDKIIRLDLNLDPGYDAVHITGDALHFRISGPSNVSNGVTAFLYINESGYSSPIWSGVWTTNDNTIRDLDITVPFNSGDDLFFAVANNGGGIADHFLWIDVKLNAATLIPEPSVSVLGIVTAASLLLRRKRL